MKLEKVHSLASCAPSGPPALPAPPTLPGPPTPVAFLVARSAARALVTSSATNLAMAACD
ncbi:hypothetical protein Tco_0638833, partial [Tanacetum coccineum]